MTRQAILRPPWGGSPDLPRSPGKPGRRRPRRSHSRRVTPLSRRISRARNRISEAAAWTSSSAKWRGRGQRAAARLHPSPSFPFDQSGASFLGKPNRFAPRLKSRTEDILDVNKSHLTHRSQLGKVRSHPMRSSYGIGRALEEVLVRLRHRPGKQRKEYFQVTRPRDGTRENRRGESWRRRLWRRSRC